MTSRFLRLLITFIAVFALQLIAGCGHRYHLPGHHEHNLAEAPDIEIRVGKSRKVVSRDLLTRNFFGALLKPPSSMITIEDEEIARVVPDEPAARIEALRTGRTKAHYFLGDDPNAGFWITVIPRSEQDEAGQPTTRSAVVTDF